MASLPLVISWISVAASAATAVAGGVAQVAAGKAANQDAKAEARMLREIGEIEAADKRRETRRLIAAQQVAFAGAGVDTQVGTPLDVLGDTVAEAELEALRIQFGRGLEADAIRRRGKQAKAQAIAGSIGSFGQGLGTILGATGDFIARPD